MSVSEMSATLQNKIAESIEQAITKNGRLQLNVRSQTAHLDYTSQDRIRTDTNSASGKHESIMSRGALDKLKTSLKDYTQETQIVGLTDEIINKLNLEDFVKFILENYGDSNTALKKSSARNDPNFEYTAPVRLGGSSSSRTRLIVGTSTEGEANEAGEKGDRNRDIIILKNIPHGTLTEYFTEYIKNNADLRGIDSAAFTKQLKSLFNAGHLTGVFTGRLIRSFGVRNKSTFSVAGGDAEVGSIVQAAIDLATTADLLSSNIYDDPELFIRTDKRLYENAVELRLTTEVQFARAVGGEKGNQDVGQLLSTAGRYLSNAIKAIKSDVSKTGRAKTAGTEVQKLFKELEKINKYIKDREAALRKQPIISDKLNNTLEKALATTKVFEQLISSQGSDSILEHIAKLVSKPLDPKIKLGTGTSKAKASRTLKKSGAPTPKKIDSKVKANLSKITATIKATTKPSPKYLNTLSSLQSLLDANLVQRVKQNMGSGSSRTVLNLRTGRLAESVKVERLSESRAGMITAFYSYMKNPYATFSDGGQQSSPKSRDPKLLISKSIREIAQQQVANRLRAVAI
jgi:hypothetical protein